MDSTDGKPIFVFDNPRTRSHLFWRWLGTHPNLRTEYHPFLLAAHLGPENFYRDVRCSSQRRKVIEDFDVTAEVTDTFESATKNLQDFIDRASTPDRRLLVSDHCHRLIKRNLLFSVIRSDDKALWSPLVNPTLIPDSLVASFVPIILIRHPVFTIPSFYETMTRFNLSFESDGEDMRLQTTLTYARMIFGYLHTSSGSKPLVVDGDDIVWRTNELKENLCNALDLDAAGVHESWQPTPEEERPSNPYIWEFTKVAHESVGIQQVRSKPTIPSAEQAFEKWSEAFGGDVASHLKCLLETELTHYNYLQQFKI